MADVVLNVDSLQKPVNLNHLAQVLKQVSGVTAVHIDRDTDQAAVSYEPYKVDTFELVMAVQDAGYRIYTESVTLLVGGMNCASCAFHIETALTEVPGVVAANVHLQTGETAVTIADNRLGLNMLYEKIQEAGYYPSGLVIGD
jgi:Cu+-exporting ATPase